MKISDEQLRQFERDGFLVVDSILENQQILRTLRAMDRVYSGIYNQDIRPAANRGPIRPLGTDRSVNWILNARLVDADIWSLATDASLGETAARLLDSSRVSLVEDQLLDKPGHAVPVNLHQDYSYWRFSTSSNMLTCWIALCDMTAPMGPLELITGSHRWGSALRPRELIHGSVEEYLTAASSIAAPDAQLDFAPAVVQRGGGVFFHALTFHGSRGNETSLLRRAVSLHWAGSDCRLDRAKLIDYDYPYMFAGLRQGDPLRNRYMPQVHPS